MIDNVKSVDAFFVNTVFFLDPPTSQRKENKHGKYLENSQAKIKFTYFASLYFSINVLSF